MKKKNTLDLVFTFAQDGWWKIQKSKSKIKAKSRKKFQDECESAAECIDCGLTMSGLWTLTGETMLCPSFPISAGNYPGKLSGRFIWHCPSEAQKEHERQVEHSRCHPQGCGEFAQLKSSSTCSARPFWHHSSNLVPVSWPFSKVKKHNLATIFIVGI